MMGKRNAMGPSSRRLIAVAKLLMPPVSGTLASVVRRRWSLEWQVSLAGRAGKVSIFRPAELAAVGGRFTICHPWPSGLWTGVRTPIFHEGLFRADSNLSVREVRLKCSFKMECYIFLEFISRTAI